MLNIQIQAHVLAFTCTVLAAWFFELPQLAETVNPSGLTVKSYKYIQIRMMHDDKLRKKVLFRYRSHETVRYIPSI